MKTQPRLLAVTTLLVAVYAASAGPAAGQATPSVVQPGAPGDSSRTVDPESPNRQRHHRHAEADVHFMQGMIPHHAQALEMTALVPTRSERPDLLLLAQRIEVAQADEIAWMQRWLQDRQEEVPAPDARKAHHGDEHHALMPGMLTPADMAELAGATGPEFDRLFLQFMIRHHEGALVMVRDLLAAPGAAQATEVFRLASDIDADQRADIDRMEAMLDAPPLPRQPRSSPHRH